MKSHIGQYIRSTVPALLAGSMFATSLFVPTDFTVAQADISDATVKVEVKPADVITSSFGKAMGLKNLLENQGDEEAKMIQDIASINAVVAFPEKLDDFMQAIQSKKSPVEFYAVVKFNDSSTVEQLKSKISADSTTFEKDGRTHYRPDNGDPNFSVTFADGKTLVFATDNYAINNGNLDKVTGNLKSIKAGDAPFSISADIDGNRELIDEALAMAKQNPAAAPFVLIPKQMDTLNIKVDMDGEELIVITGESKDEATAKKLKTSFTGLVSMGKSAIQVAPAGDPKLDFAKELVNSMTTSMDGTKVMIVLPRPEEFQERMSKMLER